MEIGDDDDTLEWRTYYQPHNLAAADASEIGYKVYDGNVDKENDSTCMQAAADSEDDVDDFERVAKLMKYVHLKRAPRGVGEGGS